MKRALFILSLCLLLVGCENANVKQYDIIGSWQMLTGYSCNDEYFEKGGCGEPEELVDFFYWTFTPDGKTNYGGDDVHHYWRNDNETIVIEDGEENDIWKIVEYKDDKMTLRYDSEYVILPNDYEDPKWRGRAVHSWLVCTMQRVK